MAGEFEQLLPFTWRGLHFPILKISYSIAHDLVEHKYWGVNGGRIEDTGVAPARISVTIPIANSIFPGKKEQWAAGALYPEALRKFLIAFGKTTTGFIQHPEFGEIACKPEKMSFELAGDKQDSTTIEASWIETEEFAVNFVESPVQDIEFGASDLNASGVALKGLVPHLPEFKDDLESLGRKLTALVDTFSVLSYRSAGAINKILYQAHRLEVSIERAATNELGQVSPLRPFANNYTLTGGRRAKQHALTWPALEALQRIKAGAYSLRRRALSPNGIGLYTVPADTTLAGVLLALPPSTPVGDLIKLNPTLARGPIVAKGTIVRYALPK